MVSTTVGSTAVDLEPAVKELAQGYDLTVRLHCILKSDGRSVTLDLVERILQAFKSSLAVLKPHTSGYTRFEIKEASKSSNNGGSGNSAVNGNGNGKSGLVGENGGEEGGGADHTRKRKGINEKSFKTVTTTPHHDGYQWRKYGEKKIRGTIFPRCYYRCTYLHEQHCQAIKQIQQLNSEDPPQYEVTYNRTHTCTNRHGKGPRNGNANGNGNGNGNGAEHCIVFGNGNGEGNGEEEEEEEEVTIVSSSSNNSKEVDPAQLRQTTQIQDASKRAKTSSLTLGMGPTQSTVTTVFPQPPAVSPQIPTDQTAAFMRRLDQELALKRAREAPVISPTPLSVAGPAQFSVVGPAQFGSMTGGSLGLDPSLLRHLNHAEATKRHRTSLSFNKPAVGPGPSENVFSNNNMNNNNNNVGNSFPPFTFLTSRFMSQNNQHNNNNTNITNSNNNNIESLFTLPSERLSNLNMNNAIMERSSARVRRSFSDNGNQMERSSANIRVERSLSQNQMDGSFRVSPNRNAPRQHGCDHNGVRKEMEGVFTLSSMESSSFANANPNNRREKQIERVRCDSMERSSDTNPNSESGVRKENQAEPSEKRVGSGISENKEQIEAVFNKNSEKSTNASESKENLSQNQNKSEVLSLSADTKPNPSANNVEKKISSINHNQPDYPSQMEGSSELNKQNPKSKAEEKDKQKEMESVLTLSSADINKSDKNSVENHSQMESMLSLSSLERTPNTNPKNNNRTEKQNPSQNREEMESFLSLSSMQKSSTSNPKSQNQREMEGMLSLSLMERSPSETSLAKHSTGENQNGREMEKNRNEMDGVLSLSSMERPSEPCPDLELNLPLSPPPPPPPQPSSSQTPKSPSQNPNWMQNPNPNPNPNPTPTPDETSHLHATVAELQSKLNKSQQEDLSTKQKLSNLESQISAIKQATQAWHRMMAEEADRRVAEAVSQLASSLGKNLPEGVNLPEGSRRTEILFPGVMEEDEEGGSEVPSLLSQLDKND